MEPGQHTFGDMYFFRAKSFPMRFKLTIVGSDTMLNFLTGNYSHQNLEALVEEINTFQYSLLGGVHFSTTSTWVKYLVQFILNLSAQTTASSWAFCQTIAEAQIIIFIGPKCEALVWKKKGS